MAWIWQTAELVGFQYKCSGASTHTMGAMQDVKTG